MNPSLERGYRRLLRAYPRSYRERRGEEMLATLLEAAPPGRARPTRGEAADLLAGAARERLGLHAVPGLAAGLRLAAPVALALAAAISVGGWMLSPDVLTFAWPGGWPFDLVLAVAWTVAVAARTIVTRIGPTMVALAWLVTLAVCAVEVGAVGGGFGRFLLTSDGDLLRRSHLATLGFGLVALLGDLLPDRPSRRVQVAVPVAAAGLIGASALFDGVGRVPPQDLSYLDGPLWQPYLWVVPVALLVVGAALAALRRGTAMLWAGLLLLPVGTIFDMSRYGVRAWVDRWSTLVGLPLIDQLALDTLLVVVVIYLAARRHTAPAGQGPSTATVVAGALCLGAAGGLAAWLLALAAARGFRPAPTDLMMMGLPAVAAVVAMITASAVRTVTMILAVTVLGAVIYSGQSSFAQLGPLATIGVLLLIALATLAPSAEVPTRAIAGAGLVTAVVLTALTRAPWSGGLADPWPLSLVVQALALAVVLPTLWWAAVTAVHARTGWTGPLVAAALALAWPLILVLLRVETWVAVMVVGLAVGVLLAGRRVVQRRADLAPGADGPPIMG